MSLIVTSIKVNENDKVTSVNWEWTTDLGRVVGDHTLQTPEGSVAVADLTSATVSGWVTSQLDTSGLDAIAAATGFGISTSTSYEILPSGAFGAPMYDSGIFNVGVEVAVKGDDHVNYGSGSTNYFTAGELDPAINTVLRLDQSDASNAGHQIAFYTDENKTTQYTTGVTSVGTAGSEGAYVTLNVLSSTPSPLYYQCTNHEKMGSTITVNFG